MLRRCELALIVIMSGAVDILPVSHELLFVVNIVVIVVSGGLHVVRHLYGISNYAGERANKKLRSQQ